MRKSAEKKTAEKKQAEKKTVDAVSKAEAVETKTEETAVQESNETDQTVASEISGEAASTTDAKKTKPGRPAKASGKTPAKAAEKPAKTAKTATVAKKEASQKIVLQVGGRADLSMEALIAKVKAAYVAEGHKAEGIQDIEVYIKLEENMAYYVIDGYASGVVLY